MVASSNRSIKKPTDRLDAFGIFGKTVFTELINVPRDAAIDFKS